MALDNLKLERANIEKIVIVGGLKARSAATVLSSLDEKPDYIINGGHFDNSSLSPTYGMTITDTIIDGKWINGGNYNGINEDRGLAWNTINDITMAPTKAIKDKGLYNYYLGGSPCLIIDGKPNENKYFNSGFATAKARRIGMGITDKYLIFSFPQNDCTAKNVANKLSGYGCKNAILLDGGGSQFVGEVKNGVIKHLDNNGKNRPVSTWICIYMKKTIRFPKVYEVTVNKLNMRTAPSTSSDLYKKAIPSGCLSKGNRITVFSITYNEQEDRYWAKSYGYYVALNCIKEV